MDIVVLKIIFLIVTLVTNFVSCLIPLKIVRRGRKYEDKKSRFNQTTILSYCNCFAGGVFLGTCFIGLMPGLKGKFTKVLRMKNMDHNYPLSELTMMIGFFIILLIEQLVITCNNYTSNDSQKLKPVKRNGLTDDAEDSSEDELFSRSIEDHPLAKKGHNGHSHDHAGHGHSHVSSIIGNESSLRSIILFLALSVHSVFEGMALGLQETVARALNLFIAIVLHECLVAFAMGISLAQLGLKFRSYCLLALLLSTMIPTGIGIGIMVGNVQGFVGGLVSAVLQALAAGTFIYVVFFEVLTKELHSGAENIGKVFFVFIGFSIIAGLQFIHLKG